MGVDGHTLLMAGILVAALGMIFGLVINTQLKNMAVHASMREVSELIYETCKTYLLEQGKFLMILWVFIGAISVAGLPPFSGFLGKLMLLRSVETGWQAVVLWPVVLVGGLGMIIALVRAGSTLFWRCTGEPAPNAEFDRIRALATICLLAGGPLLVAAAQPVHEYTQAVAQQLLDVGSYLQIVRGGER